MNTSTRRGLVVLVTLLLAVWLGVAPASTQAASPDLYVSLGESTVVPGGSTWGTVGLMPGSTCAATTATVSVAGLALTATAALPYDPSYPYFFLTVPPDTPQGRYLVTASAEGCVPSDPQTLTVTTETGPFPVGLVKTVGTEPGVCATTTAIKVPPETTVYYCYTLEYNGIYSPARLVDDKLGTIFPAENWPAIVSPAGASPYVLASAVIRETTTNTATFTAVVDPRKTMSFRGTNTGTASATVTVVASPAKPAVETAVYTG